jgi:hypothetical protein
MTTSEAEPLCVGRRLPLACVRQEQPRSTTREGGPFTPMAHPPALVGPAGSDQPRARSACCAPVSAISKRGVPPAAKTCARRVTAPLRFVLRPPPDR